MENTATYTIGYAKPPYNGKYGFNSMNIGDEKEIEGKYNLIRVAAKTHSVRYGIKVIAIKIKKGALVKRIY